MNILVHSHTPAAFFVVLQAFLLVSVSSAQMQEFSLEDLLNIEVETGNSLERKCKQSTGHNCCGS